MKTLKAIETEYRGYRFRSRLEARWAVFFDACGVKWEYEPEGYKLPNGQFYLPDFLLHDVTFNHMRYSEGNDLYVEVKGKMTAEDAEKIKGFAFPSEYNEDDWESYFNGITPLLVVGAIPEGTDMYEIEDNVFDVAFGSAPYGVPLYNFETVDGDDFGAVPGVGKDGKFQLFGADSSYTGYMDPLATERAYRVARQARFEHGQTPYIRRAWK